MGQTGCGDSLSSSGGKHAAEATAIFAYSKDAVGDEPCAREEEQEFEETDAADRGTSMELTVERTFLNFRVMDNTSDIAPTVQSAPCGVAGSAQPANPRHGQPN